MPTPERRSWTALGASPSGPFRAEDPLAAAPLVDHGEIHDVEEYAHDRGKEDRREQATLCRRRHRPCWIKHVPILHPSPPVAYAPRWELGCMVLWGLDPSTGDTVAAILVLAILVLAMLGMHIQDVAASVVPLHPSSCIGGRSHRTKLRPRPSCPPGRGRRPGRRFRDVWGRARRSCCRRDRCRRWPSECSWLRWPSSALAGPVLGRVPSVHGVRIPDLEPDPGPRRVALPRSPTIRGCR